LTKTVGRHTKAKTDKMTTFIQYLQSKNLSASTQKAYQRHVDLFRKWYKLDPVNTTKKDVLKYLEHLQKKKNQANITRKNALIALNHFFSYLVALEAISSNPTALIKIRGTHKKQLYRIYSPEELEQLFDNYYNIYVKAYDDSHIPKNQRTQSALSKQRNAAILSILIYQGTTTKEVDQIQLNDLDLIKATINIQGGKKSNPRTIPLKAAQMGLLMHYLQTIRPQLAEWNNSDSTKLFLPLPEYSRTNTDSHDNMSAFKTLTTHIKAIDKSFTNFKQVRASVLTHWLKSDGLRKTQYLAGHKHISTTERYQPNNLDGLTTDIALFNPF
jgi:site-specific recombinase XerD